MVACELLRPRLLSDAVPRVVKAGPGYRAAADKVEAALSDERRLVVETKRRVQHAIEAPAATDLMIAQHGRGAGVATDAGSDPTGSHHHRSGLLA